jgi:hypothetical protein
MVTFILGISADHANTIAKGGGNIDLRSPKSGIVPNVSSSEALLILKEGYW